MAPSRTESATPPPRDPYRTVAAPVRHEIDPVKGSRFLALAMPVSSSDDARAAIAACRVEEPDATHHCFGYRLREDGFLKSSDDGEPGGSAGRPILAQILGRELHDVLVVVTRWFGGTKLGVGGLVRAYGEAAAKALDRAEVVTVTPKRDLRVVYAYDETARVEGALRTLELEPASTSYTDRVEIVVEIPDREVDEVRDRLVELTSGRVRFPEA